MADFIFRISPYDIDRLLPQVSRALESRTELLSRERYPNLWNMTDKLGTPAKEQQGRRSKLLSILCIAAGIFLLVPGLAEPEELLVPLLAGAAAVVIGIFGLVRGKREKQDPFDKSASLLLAGKDIAPAEPLEVGFSPEGMTIPEELIPYADFECAIETEDALLLVYGDRVTLLQKRDLCSGGIDELTAFLKENIEKYKTLEQ